MCCGDRRATYHPHRSGGPPAAGRTFRLRRHRDAPTFRRYEYTGPTRLTVEGPASGRVYDFTAPGTVLDIDPRDAAALASIPGLRGRTDDL